MAFQVSQPSLIDYPDADGLPVAESDFQREPLFYGVSALTIYFQNRPDVYVSGNLFVYYEEGNPRAVIAPDVFVVIGTSKHGRPSYKLWEEPKGPDFVLEITSRSTQREDQETKPAIYASLGVREYVQYDPTGDYLQPPLQGRILVAGGYQSLPTTRLDDGTLVWRSSVLGLELRLTGDRLRFYDPGTEQPLLSHQEAEQARQAAEQARQAAEAQAHQETARREALEARLTALEARLRAIQTEELPPQTQP